MVTHLTSPSRIEAAGTPPKLIDEHVGLVATSTDALSVAVMHSPQGWSEPDQTPDFDEYTVVIRGTLRVEHDGGVIDVEEGESIHAAPGERVRYSTPDGPTEYVSVCLPAFSPARVHPRRNEARRPSGRQGSGGGGVSGCRTAPG